MAMLGWLAAAIAPWLIHWWNNRRPRKTPWAAIDLLLSAVRQRTRRVHFQQWLLLAVRTAILALVALAAAQPVWRPLAMGAASGSRTHHLILVDQSYSMSCRELSKTRFDRAQMLARQTIESAAAGDLFTVIAWSQVAENVLGLPTFQASEVLAAVDELAWSHAPADLAKALRAAEQAIARVKKQHPEITVHRTVFFSDLARNTWQPDADSSAEVEKLCRQLAKESELLVVSVDRRDSEEGDATEEDGGRSRHNNLAVTHLTASPPLAMAQDRITILATIRAWGNRANPLTSSQEVVFSVDGVTVHRQQHEIPTGGETTVRFEHRFASAGQHSIRVLVKNASAENASSEKALSEDAVDCLPLDNRRWMVLDVREHVRVACIAGKPGAAKDLTRALVPGPIHVETILASRLDETDLAQFDALFLCNVAELTERDTERLVRFAQGGGALAFFLGDRVALDSYQRLFNQLQLSVRIRPRIEVNEMRFDPLEYQHPLMEVFRGRKNAGLLAVRVSHYFPLEILPSDQPPEVALAFRSEETNSDNAHTGDPAIIIGSIGLGRAAVVAVPASLATRTAGGAPWSSLAINPSFLPLVRELLAHLVGDREQSQTNLLVSQPLVGLAPNALFGQGISVRTPRGKLVHPTMTDGAKDSTFAFAETSQSGIYSFHSDDAINNSPGNGSGSELARFAVNLDTRESDLSTILPSELPPSISLKQPNKVDKRLQPAQVVAAGDLALQRTLFAAALALLLAELLLAWSIGRSWG